MFVIVNITVVVCDVKFLFV